jgi:hypothetical protein
MKKKLKAAVEAADVPQVRSILVDIIGHGAGDTATIEDVTEAIANTPGIFEPDDGKFYAERPEDMTETLIETLRADLDRNFSLEKVRLYTEVESIKARDPRYFRDREKQMRAMAEEAGEALAAAPEPAEPSDQADPAERPAPAARVIGYVIMALGAAAAITALCVPVKFLLGLGIGIFLLGTAVTYMTLVKPTAG